jgi:hypothetical protein
MPSRVNWMCWNERFPKMPATTRKHCYQLDCPKLRITHLDSSVNYSQHVTRELHPIIFPLQSGKFSAVRQGQAQVLSTRKSEVGAPC